MALLPVYQEDEPSQLEHEGRRYSVNGLLRLSQTCPVVTVRVADMDSVPVMMLDDARVMRADYRVPVLLLMRRVPSYYTILDGAHRVAHAMIDGVGALSARILTEAMLQQALVE
jgi:hypothetical protein